MKAKGKYIIVIILAITAIIFGGILVMNYKKERPLRSNLEFRYFDEQLSYARFNSVDGVDNILYKITDLKSSKEIFNFKNSPGNYFISNKKNIIYFASAGSDNNEKGIWLINEDKHTKEKVFDEPIQNVFFANDRYFAAGIAYHADESVPIYASDNGRDWEHKGDVGTNLADDWTVIDLIIDRDNKMIVATDYGIYMSSDEGKTWENVFHNGNILSKLVPSINGNIIFLTYEADGFHTYNGKQVLTISPKSDSSLTKFWPISDLKYSKDLDVYCTIAAEKDTAKEYLLFFNDTKGLIKEYPLKTDAMDLIGIKDKDCYLYNKTTGEILRKTIE